MVDPDAKQIEVHVPGQPVVICRMDDTLDGSAVLPGFKLNVRDIFG